MSMTYHKELINVLPIFQSKYTLAISSDPNTGEPTLSAQTGLSIDGIATNDITLVIGFQLTGDSLPVPVRVEYPQIYAYVSEGKPIEKDVLGAPQFDDHPLFAPCRDLPTNQIALSPGVYYDPDNASITCATPPVLLSSSGVPSTLTVFLNPDCNIEATGKNLVAMRVLPTNITGDELVAKLNELNNPGETKMAGSSRARTTALTTTPAPTTTVEEPTPAPAAAPAPETSAPAPTPAPEEPTVDTTAPPFDVEEPTSESAPAPSDSGITPAQEPAYTADHPRPARKSLSENQIASIYKKPNYALIDYGRFLPDGTSHEKVEEMLYDHLAQVSGIIIEDDPVEDAEPTVEEMLAEIAALSAKIAAKASGPTVDVEAVKASAVEDYKKKVAETLASL